MQTQLEFDNGRVLELIEGDITRLAAEAIANAATGALAGGGGVDGAIHRAGGPTIMQELDLIRAQIGGRLMSGQAVATGAGRLPARYVFHAVGPVWRGGEHNEPALLASCYRACLRMAEERKLASLHLPSISTGVYGYPIEAAARVALSEIHAFLATEAQLLRRVAMVLFGADAYTVYAHVLEELNARWRMKG
jgi:O-acetyl-ADP-ribose deacetylase (regulator of RNase III)